jgi:hypothetical protein
MNAPCCNFHKRFSRRKVINNILPILFQILHTIANKKTKYNNAIKGLKVLKIFKNIYEAKGFKVKNEKMKI